MNKGKFFVENRLFRRTNLYNWWTNFVNCNSFFLLNFNIFGSPEGECKAKKGIEICIEFGGRKAAGVACSSFSGMEFSFSYFHGRKGVLPDEILGIMEIQSAPHTDGKCTMCAVPMELISCIISMDKRYFLVSSVECKWK